MRSGPGKPRAGTSPDQAENRPETSSAIGSAPPPRRARDRGAARRPRLGAVTNTEPSTEAILAHVAATAADDEALAAARADAAELGLAVPDPATGELLALLASLAAGAGDGADGRGPQAVVVSPAAGVVGLQLLAGLPEQAHLSCIDPDTEHQRLARAALAGTAGRHRFLPARPLDVMGRLAAGAYDLVYVDADPAELLAVREAAWPLLRPGGVLFLAGSLLDGTVGDATRHDRATVAAREADAELRGAADAVVARIPAGPGATVLRKLG